MLSQFNPVDHADGGRTWINSTDSCVTSGERLATAELGVQMRTPLHTSGAVPSLPPSLRASCGVFQAC
jgi:hypothetical protein